MTAAKPGRPWDRTSLARILARDICLRWLVVVRAKLSRSVHDMRQHRSRHIHIGTPGNFSPLTGHRGTLVLSRNPYERRIRDFAWFCAFFKKLRLSLFPKNIDLVLCVKRKNWGPEQSYIFQYHSSSPSYSIELHCNEISTLQLNEQELCNI